MGHRPQPDAVFQVVHLVEVIAPAAVDHREHHAPFEFAHRGLAEIVGALVVRELGIGENLFAQELARGLAPRTRLGQHLIDRDRDGVQGAQLRPHRVQIPVIRAAFTGVHVDDLVDHVVEELRGAVFQVIALEDVAAVAIDRFALPVEHIVVLQHVLADLGVTALHLALGGTDGAAHDLRFDREIVGDITATHE